MMASCPSSKKIIIDLVSIADSRGTDALEINGYSLCVFLVDLYKWIRIWHHDI